MSINTIKSKISGFTDGGLNTALEMRDVLTDITDTFSGATSDSTLDSITFDTVTPSGVWAEGKIEWDNVNKTIKMYTDEPDIAQQMGQEMWMRVFNDTVSTIPDGKVVTVVGVSATGVPHIDLAIASIELSALNSIGFSTHAIEAGTFGYVTTRGFVNDVDTTAGAEGALIYLSADVAGEITDTLPTSPAWEVKVGGIAKSGVTDGVFYVEMLVLNNLQGLTKFYNGSILENATVSVYSDGNDITLTMDNVLSGQSLSLIFDEGFYVKSQPQTITLTGGTDSVPIANYVYIPNSTKNLTLSLVGFPVAEQFIPVATLMVQSAASVQVHGVYKLHNWVDDLSNEYGVGHLTDINAFIRQSFPKYKSGNVLTPSEAEGSSVARIDLQYTNAVVSQLHFHLVPGYDTSLGSDDHIFLINDFNEPYKILSGLTATALSGDSTGTAINNNYYNVVIWGTVSEDFNDCKLFMNLPNSSYSQLTAAIDDNQETANYSIDRDYSGSGYLMTRLVLKNTGSNIEIVVGGIESLLGLVPSVSAGGGTTSGPVITGVGADSVITSAKVDEAAGITKGQVVYITGAQTTFPTVGLADNTDFVKSDVLAIATETKSDNQTILITQVGSLIDFDTSDFNDGDIAYLSTGGTMTNIHPTGLDTIQRIGHIINAHSTQGSMLVKIEQLSVIANNDDFVRNQLINISSGTSATVNTTYINDGRHYLSINITGSNSQFGASEASWFNTGHGISKFINDGDKGFNWYSDIGDAHSGAYTKKMELTASGDLTLYSGSTTAQAFITSGGTANDFVKGDGTLGVITGMKSQVTTFTASEFGNSNTTPKVGLTGEVGKIKIPIMLKTDYTHVSTGYTGFNAIEFLGKAGVYVFDDGGETSGLSADDSFSNIIGKSINSIGENIDITLGLAADDLTGDGTVICTVYYNEITL